MRRGEVWWVEQPEIGRRPYLVLARDAAITVLNAVVSVPATRTVRGIPTEVAIGPEEGMPEPCVLTLDNVTVMPKAFFVERIAALAPDVVGRVRQALAHATACY